jgi:hypothetical protein
MNRRACQAYSKAVSSNRIRAYCFRTMDRFVDSIHVRCINFGNQPRTGIDRRLMTFSISAWILACWVCLAAAEPAAHAGPSEELADAARQLIGNIRETHYQHPTHVVASAGIYDMDCSGFVDYLLKRVAPERYAQIPIEPGHARPRAAVYYHLFEGLTESRIPGWESLKQLADVKAGDIIAWALAPSTQGDTGHVLVVAARPVAVTTDESTVEVYDSSAILHDDDTRPEGTTGVGRGVIMFKVDEHGIPVGFRFNSDAHLHIKPIAIGRIIEQR